MKSWDDMMPAEKKVRLIARKQKKAEDQLMLDKILSDLKNKHDQERKDRIEKARTNLESLLKE